MSNIQRNSVPLDGTGYGTHDVDPHAPDVTTQTQWVTHPGSDGINELQEPDGPAMMSLHPNLARIAVRYQRIRTQRVQGRISHADADIALAELIARDDYGVMWTINPQDGGWLYLTKSNTWQPGEPPTSGVATASSYALDRAAGSGLRFDNPDLAIVWTEPERDSDPWAGAIANRPTEDSWQRPFWLYPALTFIAVVVIGFFAFNMLSDSPGTDIAPADTIPAATVDDETAEHSSGNDGGMPPVAQEPVTFVDNAPAAGS